MKLIQLFVVCLLFVVSALSYRTVNNQRYEPNWKSIDSRPLPEWYDKAKVGIFLHWGVFSVPSFGNEWFWEWWLTEQRPQVVDYMARYHKPNYTYPEFASQFTAELFDPNRWADLFNKSGARYVVLTTKHHEGFTLWPSKFSFNWNAMDVGPNRDLVGELGEAVRSHGLRYGLYHSLFEWYNPMYHNDKINSFKTNDFVKYKVRPEMEELVNAYQPDLFWSDGDGDVSDNYWNSTDFLAWLYNESAVKDKVVVNDRWGAETSCQHGGYYTCDDRYNPGVLQAHKWENAMAIDLNSYGYRREATLDDYISIEQLISTMVSTVSCGGNILINLGPTKDGTIIPIFEERLRQLGQWLAINGDAIYDTTPWKFQNDTLTEDVWYTQKNGVVYAIVLNYPEDDMVQLGSIQYDSVESVQLIGSGTKIAYWRGQGRNVIVQFPTISPRSPLKYAYVFEFKLVA